MFVYCLYQLSPREGVANPVTGDKVKQYPIFLQQLQLKVLATVSECDMYIHVASFAEAVILLYFMLPSPPVAQRTPSPSTSAVTRSCCREGFWTGRRTLRW